MVVHLKNQEEFDQLIKAVKQHARDNFSIYSFLDGRKTPNFTNHLELIDYGGHRYLVKTSKFFSDFLYNLKSVADFTRGKEAAFLWNGNRQQYEAGVIDELTANGVNVPKRVFTGETGVLVLEYHEGEETKLVLRDDARYLSTLQILSTELGKIHQIGLHGEPSTNNTFISNGHSYWIDFERFSRNVTNARKVREVVTFIRSASKHSYRSLESVAKIVLGVYPNPQVVDLTRKFI